MWSPSGTMAWDYAYYFRDYSIAHSCLSWSKTGCHRGSAYFLDIEPLTYIISPWAFYLQNVGMGDRFAVISLEGADVTGLFFRGMERTTLRLHEGCRILTIAVGKGCGATKTKERITTLSYLYSPSHFLFLSFLTFSVCWTHRTPQYFKYILKSNIVLAPKNFMSS